MTGVTIPVPSGDTASLSSSQDYQAKIADELQKLKTTERGLVGGFVLFNFAMNAGPNATTLCL